MFKKVMLAVFIGLMFFSSGCGGGSGNNNSNTDGTSETNIPSHIAFLENEIRDTVFATEEYFTLFGFVSDEQEKRSLMIFEGNNMWLSVSGETGKYKYIWNMGDKGQIILKPKDPETERTCELWKTKEHGSLNKIDITMTCGTDSAGDFSRQLYLKHTYLFATSIRSPSVFYGLDIKDFDDNRDGQYLFEESNQIRENCFISDDPGASVYTDFGFDYKFGVKAISAGPYIKAVDRKCDGTLQKKRFFLFQGPDAVRGWVLILTYWNWRDDPIDPSTLVYYLWKVQGMKNSKLMLPSYLSGTSGDNFGDDSYNRILF